MSKIVSTVIKQTWRTCCPWGSILARRRRTFPCDWCSTGRWWRHRSCFQTTTLASLAGTRTDNRL